MEEEMGRFNAHVGFNVIKNRLCSKQVFIVLDDADEIEQIEALACSIEWFGSE
ncbi:hypothetical protein CJ030_MR5G006242 [Morella rubra]|uniref:TMV resistance protein N n=1 Tax=Morella rubra TaxID=262757 RepID=A0A6A1VL57_9ROSI|nr:hypothetical protein CJ030_MR5G006242 [Morella rubra]